MTEAEASAPESITHPSGNEASKEVKEVSQDLKKDQQPIKDGRKQEEDDDKEEEEEEEEEACGFCKFMKAGGCKESFVNWMECVDSEKAKGNDFVETCMTQIQDLRNCMLAHSDYYRPMLEEEESLFDDIEESEEREVSEHSITDNTSNTKT